MKSILGIGNALTDILAVLPDDAFLKKYHLPKGSMQHVDMETGEQLKFKNVLVQYTDHDFVGDTYLLEVHVIKEGEGTGMYFTDGKAVPIKWKKESWEDRTHYYTADGQPLNLNPGKTMIQIIPESYGITYSADGAAVTADAQPAAEEEWSEETVG